MPKRQLFGRFYPIPKKFLVFNSVTVWYHFISQYRIKLQLVHYYQPIESNNLMGKKCLTIILHTQTSSGPSGERQCSMPSNPSALVGEIFLILKLPSKFFLYFIFPSINKALRFCPLPPAKILGPPLIQNSVINEKLLISRKWNIYKNKSANTN